MPLSDWLLLGNNLLMAIDCILTALVLKAVRIGGKHGRK